MILLLNIENIINQFSNEEMIIELKKIFHKNYINEKSLNIEIIPTKCLFKTRIYPNNDIIEIKFKMKYSKSHYEKISRVFLLDNLNKEEIKNILNATINNVEDFSKKSYRAFRRDIDGYNEELQKIKDKYTGV